MTALWFVLASLSLLAWAVLAYQCWRPAVTRGKRWWSLLPAVMLTGITILNFQSPIEQVRAALASDLPVPLDDSASLTAVTIEQDGLLLSVQLSHLPASELTPDSFATLRHDGIAKYLCPYLKRRDVIDAAIPIAYRFLTSDWVTLPIYRASLSDCNLVPIPVKKTDAKPVD